MNWRVLCFLFCVFPLLQAKGEISLSSLLDEMGDRTSISLWPSPSYTCRQASSYNRESVSPEKEGWFANDDGTGFIREEERNGRREIVLFDSEGPGAVTRFWLGGKADDSFGDCKLYFFFDDAEEPLISGEPESLISYGLLADPPFSANRARGNNLYLPIPYAHRLKITCDLKKEERIWFNINYRTYEPGTEVRTFSLEELGGLRGKLAELGRRLLNPAESVGEFACAESSAEDQLEPGAETEPIRLKGPGTIREISVKLDADDLTRALRSTVIIAKFDGEETVWVPIGEFFGSGVGVNLQTTWYTRVEEDGRMTCWWPMPFRDSAEISFRALGVPTRLTASVLSDSSPWTDRSMHFHGTWRQERNIPVLKWQGTCDWNYLTVRGKGVYAGDVLSLVNRVPDWWGEGDEKIYVDGESFPSHFGTGVEDYYGYSYAAGQRFDSPFHAQTLTERPKSYGNTTNLRFRILDGIPFTTKFKFDMELFHVKKTEIDFAAATFWYAFPGAEREAGPSAEELQTEAASPVWKPYPPVKE